MSPPSAGVADRWHDPSPRASSWHRAVAWPPPLARGEREPVDCSPLRWASHHARSRLRFRARRTRESIQLLASNRPAASPLTNGKSVSSSGRPAMW